MITQLFGEIDFSSDMIPLQRIKALYESDFPYLEITPEGTAYLYGIPSEVTVQTPVFSVAEIAEEPIAELYEQEAPEEKPVKAIRKKKNHESL